MLIIFAAIIALIMEKQSFDYFKQRLIDWKEIHSDEYDLFEEDMNSIEIIPLVSILMNI